MPDLTHDGADDGFHEIQLNGKQLVFLFIVTTLVSVAIFLCGVLVGRGARAARGEEPAQVAADAAPAPAPAPVPQPVADAGPPAAEPPPPATESPDELSYHKRLQGETPAETLKSRAPTAAPKPAPAVAAAAPPKSAPPPARAPEDVPSAGQPGTWVVQVQALRDRAVAVSLVHRLTGQGYPAFLVTPSPESAPQFYKVHVGRYNDRREAEQVKRRLEKEEQFKPWISR